MQSLHGSEGDEKNDEAGVKVDRSHVTPSAVEASMTNIVSEFSFSWLDYVDPSIIKISESESNWHARIVKVRFLLLSLANELNVLQQI